MEQISSKIVEQISSEIAEQISRYLNMQGAKQAKVTDIGGECCLDLPLGNFQLPSPQLAPICGVVKIPSAETEPSQDAVFEFLSLRIELDLKI